MKSRYIKTKCCLFLFNWFVCTTAFAQGYTMNSYLLDDYRAQISWDGEAQGWRLERRVANGEWKIIAELSGGKTGFIDSSLTIEVPYSYRLTDFFTEGSEIVQEISLKSHLKAPEIAGAISLSGQSALIWWNTVDENARKVELHTCDNPWKGFTTRAQADARQGWMIVDNLEVKRVYRMLLKSVTPRNISDAGPEKTYVHEEPLVEWIFMPECRYLRGGHFGDEAPQREVELSPYFLGRCELNNRLYLHFCVEEGEPFPAEPKFTGVREYAQRFPDHPVVNVSWYDAVKFCNWLSKKMNLPPAYDEEGTIINSIGIRLPTEAEWENAAHLTGGEYPWGNRLPTHSLSNYIGTSRGRRLGEPAPLEVGSFPSSPGGFFDLAGNVWEWCQDWYHQEGYQLSGYINPQGPFNGLFKTVRGGSWADGSEMLRSCNRGKLSPETCLSTVGFRPLMPAPIKPLQIVDSSLAEVRNVQSK